MVKRSHTLWQVSGGPPMGGPPMGFPPMGVAAKVVWLKMRANNVSGNGVIENEDIGHHAGNHLKIA